MEALPENVNEEGPAAALRALFNQVPVEVQQSIQYLLTAGSQVFGAAYLHETITPMIQILHFMGEGRMCAPEAAQGFLQQAQNHTAVGSNTECILSYMTSPQDAPQAVKKTVAEGIQFTVNGMIIISAVFSGIQLAVSWISLRKLHDAVKDAWNILESSKIKLADISKTLKLIETQVSELDGVLQALNQEGISIYKIFELVNKVNRIKQETESNIRSCNDAIYKLEFEVQKKKVTLGEACRHANLAGFSSVVNSITSAINIGLLAGVGNPVLVGIYGTLAGLNLIVGLVCPAYAYISRKELEELSKMLVKIDGIKAKVAEFESDLNAKLADIYSKNEALRSTFPQN